MIVFEAIFVDTDLSLFVCVTVRLFVCLYVCLSVCLWSRPHSKRFRVNWFRNLPVGSTSLRSRTNSVKPSPYIASTCARLQLLRFPQCGRPPARKHAA